MAAPTPLRSTWWACTMLAIGECHEHLETAVGAVHERRVVAALEQLLEARRSIDEAEAQLHRTLRLSAASR